MVDLSVLKFKKFIISLLVMSVIVFVVSLGILFSLKSSLIKLNTTIGQLKEEMKPLQSFYNKKTKLVDKGQYDELVERYNKLAGKQKDTATRLEEKEQMVINLMHGLEEVKRNSLDLREKNEDLKLENEGLKDDIEFQKLKLKDNVDGKIKTTE